MAEDFSDQPRRSSLGRLLAVLAAVVVVLLVVAYLVISSSAFLKGFVLPRVGKAMNAEVTVANASLSPFSQVTLQKLKVQPNGKEPLLTADEVRVRYSLMAILKGNYVVDELSVTAPNIQIIKEANGSSNLDPITKGEESKPSGPKSEAPMRLSVNNVSIKDGVVRTVARARDGSSKTTELAQWNITVDRLANGQSGKLTVAAALKLDNRAAAGKPGTNDLMEGKLNGTFEFKLDPKLLPQTLSGNGQVAFSRGEGAYAELAGLGANLQAEVSPTEIKQLGVRFERGGQALGRIQASGPLDLTKAEGRVKLEIQSIDRQVLNLFGARRGWDFAGSTLNATNIVDLARQGEIIGAKGVVVGRQLSIRQQAQATPPVDLDVDYEVTVNVNDQSAVIRKLTLAGREQQRDFLDASLNKPMTITWGPQARGYTGSIFQLTLTQLDLKSWQPVLGTNLPSGRLDWQLNVTATNDAKNVKVISSMLIQDLAVRVGTNQLDRARLATSVEAEIENLKTIKIESYQFDLQQRAAALVKGSGSANYDLSLQNLSLQASAEVAGPSILRQFPVTGVSASNGVVRLSAAVTQRNQKYAITGNVSLADFTGLLGACSFKDLQTSLDYNIDFESPALRIHSASLSVRKGYTSGGTLTVSGDYDLDKSTAEMTFKALELNENALGPLLAPSLGDKKLTSISLSGSGTTSYDPKGEASIKADLTVTNWVVTGLPPQPDGSKLGAQVQLDGALRQQVMDLRECVLRLAPTARANNQLLAKAHLDMSATNATPSQLTIQAEALDVTPYYQMFAGKGTNAAPVQTTDTRPVAVPAGPAPAEPAPMSLPIKQLTAEIKIGRLYLGELAVTNLQVAAKVNGGEINVQPVEMTLNGAPVSARAALNVGVPGYTYDVSFKGDRVPIEPLANTFSSNPPGSFKGDFFANANIKGAGISGPSLRKNLGGDVSLNMTNLNYEIVGRKTKRLLEPIAAILRVPELMQTPINWIVAKTDIGQGQVNLQQFTVQSAAFLAESRGTITMADVLTNSPLNLPVTLSLRRTLAEKANLLAANTPTNAVYVALPSFVTLAGTVGDPKTEVNKLVIGGLLAKSIGGLVPLDARTSSLVQGVGGLLSGQSGGGVSTNAPANTNAAANIVQGIGGLLNQPKTATNAPAAARTNTTTKPGISDLLKLIPQKK